MHLAAVLPLSSVLGGAGRMALMLWLDLFTIDDVV
jgi:hypothetical protein